VSTVLFKILCHTPETSLNFPTQDTHLPSKANFSLSLAFLFPQNPEMRQPRLFFTPKMHAFEGHLKKPDGQALWETGGTFSLAVYSMSSLSYISAFILQLDRLEGKVMAGEDKTGH